uniref:uncharacterized protein LOC777724 precursor n=1 Tax=Danio rerio TaxID=7955 RepID=UPI000054C9F1|nr:uncharacterized protein LOC777724 precursor [Danio rerio]AAH98518.1 Zgc:109782 [Danio rerio]
MIPEAFQPRAMKHTTTVLMLALSSRFWSVCADFPEVFGGESAGFGPVFEEQPLDTIYPEESPEEKITLTCRTRANPPASYRWRLNNAELVLAEGGDPHYSVSEGNLLISSPDKSKHAGNYTCVCVCVCVCV